MINWFKKRREQKKRTEFENGWALGAVEYFLKGVDIETLENYSDTARQMGDYTEFDRGLDNFLLSLRRATVVPREEVYSIATSNGFNPKPQTDGEMDLNPYVYEFANKLVARQLSKLKAEDIKVLEFPIGLGKTK